MFSYIYTYVCTYIYIYIFLCPFQVSSTMILYNPFVFSGCLVGTSVEQLQEAKSYVKFSFNNGSSNPEIHWARYCIDFLRKYIVLIGTYGYLFIFLTQISDIFVSDNKPKKVIYAHEQTSPKK